LIAAVNPATLAPTPESKRPRRIIDDSTGTIDAFPPNRDTLGGTAYLVTHPEGNILIDTPAWHEENQAFLQAQGVRWCVLTHRGGIGKKIMALQAALQCEVLIQEQEAYLIPDVTTTTFGAQHQLAAGIELIWTAGHSPGSSCVHAAIAGGVLFSGRHLLPNRQADPAPLRTSKTFHWPRQLRNTQMLLDRFTPTTLSHICPGASIGFLRGATTITPAYARLAAIDWPQLQASQPLL
jgi:glyoxylase-like metal-dependent hydrolase (beta-lactamase superfamily II)